MSAARAITGAAGAYYVVAVLSERGWIASPTWGNAPRTDILAQRAEGTRVAAIQVKTHLAGPSFQLGNTVPTRGPTGGNEWFVLVWLNGPAKRPDFYIVPRNHVVALAHCGNEIFIRSPRRGGGERKTSRVAIKPGDVERYKEQWHLLDDQADLAPWMIPEWVWDAAEMYPPPVKLGAFAAGDTARGPLAPRPS